GELFQRRYYAAAAEEALGHLLFERGHRLVGDAAGHDQIEGVEVGGYVKGEAMRGHGARDVHADGGNLARYFLLRPDAGQAGNVPGDHAEVAAGADQRLFQLAHELDGANPGIEAAKVEDGIADELSGAVEGDVAAAVGLMQLHAAGGEELARSNDVL